MIIVFNCPGCGAILRMKEQYGGQRGRCPHCQGAITVPAIETEAGMDLLPLDEGAAGHAAGNGPTAPPQTPPSFSLASRFPAMVPSTGEATPSPSSAAGARMPIGGDSNIGLAPIEEPKAKATTSPQPVTSSAAPKTSAGDSILGLAPLDEVAAKSTASAPSPKSPASAPAPRSPAGDSDLGLAPLEAGGAEHKAAKPAPAAAAKPSDTSKPTTKTDKIDDVQRIVCNKCGAKMRVPPAAAGKQVSCPKCKNKMRVPETVATATVTETKKASSSDETISLADTSSSSSDLSAGMLDMLDDGASTAGAGEAAQAAPLSSPKLAGGRSKSGTILGLPPLAVYGGAGGITLLLVSLIVYIVVGGGSKTQPSVAQSPPVATPPANTTAPAAPTKPTPTPAPTAGTTPPLPGIGGLVRPTPPADGNPSAPAATAPMNATAGTSPPGALPAAAAGNWKQRMPILRIQGGTEPKPGDPRPAEVPNMERVNLVFQFQSLQTQAREVLAQITDVDAARRQAPLFADTMAQGLDTVRKIRLGGGLPKPDAGGAGPPRGGLAGAAMRSAAEKASGPALIKSDMEAVQQIDAELNRAGQLPGVIPIVEEELLKRATAEPNGALAAALVERGVAVPGAAPK